jgi:hypothetical protein
MTKGKLMQDKVLEVLKGTGKGKRPRKGSTMEVYLREGGYTIQVNGRTVVDTDGTRGEAIADAEERAKRMKALTGKDVTINVY